VLFADAMWAIYRVVKGFLKLERQQAGDAVK
jgi:uncharacterized membrane protein